MRGYLVFLAFVYLERLVELVVSGRSVRRALRAGAREAGRAHFPAMVAFHALYLAACGMEVALRGRGPPDPVVWAALGLFLLAQGLRWWSVATLGTAWSVRIIVPPRPLPVTTGPYRWLRHPNYLAVIMEVLAVPLVGGAWLAACGGTLINGLLLRVRIQQEEEALGPAYARAFAGRRRLIPEVRRARP
jgi:methyltransferase